MDHCQWPKGCDMGQFAYVDEIGDVCGLHLLEWLSNWQWRDDFTGAHFSIAHKHREHTVYGYVKPTDEQLADSLLMELLPVFAALPQWLLEAVYEASHEIHIQRLVDEDLSLPTCPDCGGRYTPPMSPDHSRYCTGRKRQ